ncbi:MAG: class I SAM-dependent methyltransferase [Chlorobiales bacterium]|nr:class I SAM-dependent methyltransferase [Chlorobiales bacterium]
MASGAAPELRDVIRTASDAERFQVTLLDQDKIALHEAGAHIREVESRLGVRIGIEYLNHSVRTMLMAPQLKDGLGRFDLIYSMGLFDYLTPRVAAALLGKLIQLLRPGGEMIVGNFHVSSPSRYYMEYWLDWVLFYRTEAEFLSLLDNSPAKDRARTFFEDSGCQMFMQIEN